MKRRRSTRSDTQGRRLLSEILGAADRDHCPGARPIVAFREEDDPEYLAYVRERALRIVAVSRFGRPLLSVAEFAGRRVLGAALSERERKKVWLSRWRTARPIVLRGFASALLRRESAPIARWNRVLATLRKPHALKRFLSEELGPAAIVRAPKLDDPTRDLEKFFVRDTAVGHPLWIKSATLTSPTTNASARLRFSFGAEGDDDASTDKALHERVAQLARRCLPVADAFAESAAHAGFLKQLVGSPVLLTQHIAYWNAPEGGALLHHDAFHEPSRTRQRGVCYVQLSGATIWLALRTADLVRHMRGFLAALEAGEAPWVVDERFDGARSFARIAHRARDVRWLESELTAPGCGAFSRVVNFSPEFLSVLIDAGHAFRLEAGDTILLPNFGHHRTCLHAVWSASPTPGAALSMALRIR